MEMQKSIVVAAEFEDDYAACGAENIWVRLYRGLACGGEVWFSSLEQRKTPYEF